MKNRLRDPRAFLPALAGLLLSLSGVSGAGASILGSAGNFTLLGGTGITSSGAAGTVISNGNVGLSPAATTNITGFPPAVIVNGGIIATGGATAQARLDLIRAQAGLAGMRSDKNLSNVDLAGLTLPPGVYTFNENANLTGALVLDARGRNNVYWVFQIGTALTTAINATVTIINPGSNGGSDVGIFWNCGSAINIGGNNQIAGIYLAGTSIVFGSNSTRGGRALALAAITLDNNQIDAHGGPGGTDYSGGLRFDATGAVVASDKLAFRYFGRHHRFTHSSHRVIRGDASSNATRVQYRVNMRNWHSAGVQLNTRWSFTARHLHFGKSRIWLRALDAHGNKTAFRRIVVTRR